MIKIKNTKKRMFKSYLVGSGSILCISGNYYLRHKRIIKRTTKIIGLPSAFQAVGQDVSTVVKANPLKILKDAK